MRISAVSRAKWGLRSIDLGQMSDAEGARWGRTSPMPTLGLQHKSRLRVRLIQSMGCVRNLESRNCASPMILHGTQHVYFNLANGLSRPKESSAGRLEPNQSKSCAGCTGMLSRLVCILMDSLRSIDRCRATIRGTGSTRGRGLRRRHVPTRFVTECALRNDTFGRQCSLHSDTPRVVDVRESFTLADRFVGRRDSCCLLVDRQLREFS